MMIQLISKKNENYKKHDRMTKLSLINSCSKIDRLCMLETPAI